MANKFLTVINKTMEKEKKVKKVIMSKKELINKITDFIVNEIDKLGFDISGIERTDIIEESERFLDSTIEVESSVLDYKDDN